VRESRTPGSARGGRGDPVPYRYIVKSGMRSFVSAHEARAVSIARAHSKDQLPPLDETAIITRLCHMEPVLPRALLPLRSLLSVLLDAAATRICVIFFSVDSTSHYCKVRERQNNSRQNSRYQLGFYKFAVSSLPGG
jgi:hypothetical protein